VYVNYITDFVAIRFGRLALQFSVILALARFITRCGLLKASYWTLPYFVEI
jgi:phage-related protein